MSKAFAWIMGVIAIVMLILQFAVADSPKIAVGAFWALVLALCIYVLFLKKPPEEASK